MPSSYRSHACKCPRGDARPTTATTTLILRPRAKQCIDPGIHAIDATHRSIGHRFKARVEEVQQLDVVEAVFGDEGPPLDLEKV